MKKFFICAVVLILSASILTGCSRRNVSPEFVPYWGQMQTADDEYLEKSVFKISVNIDEDGKAVNEKFDPNSGGIYITTLTRVSDDNKGSIYRLKSSFEFAGKYNGKVFKDKYTSEVTFKVTSGEFTTLTSIKNVENYTVFNDDENLAAVSYMIVNDYKDKKVTSKMIVSKDTANLLKDIKTDYSGKFKDYFFDNESLFFGIRSLTPAEGFTLNYSLLDPIKRDISNMQANYVALEDNKVKLATIDDASPKVNGITTQEVECNLIKTKIFGTLNTGAPIDLYYSKDSKVTYLTKNEKTYVEVQYYFLVKIDMVT